MKNNKGFSLVELIIVIAIMAILVGVMAPQLIKYIEKSNVSSDTQLCDSVRTAITTAMMDPEVLNAPDYTATTNGTLSSMGGGATFHKAVEDTLGVTGYAQVDQQIKSTLGKGKNIEVKFVNANSVIVYIPNTNNTGNKTSAASSVTKEGASFIYSGPADLW